MSKQIPDKKVEIQNIDLETEETKGRVAELETRAVEMLKELEKLEMVLKTAENALAAKKEARGEMESALRSQGSAEMELRARVDEHRATLLKLRHSAHDIEKRLEDLKSDFERMPLIDSELQESLAGQGLISVGSASQEASQDLIKCSTLR